MFHWQHANECGAGKEHKSTPPQPQSPAIDQSLHGPTVHIGVNRDTTWRHTDEWFNSICWFCYCEVYHVDVYHSPRTIWSDQVCQCHVFCTGNSCLNNTHWCQVSSCFFILSFAISTSRHIYWQLGFLSQLAWPARSIRQVAVYILPCKPGEIRRYISAGRQHTQVQKKASIQLFYSVQAWVSGFGCEPKKKSQKGKVDPRTLVQHCWRTVARHPVRCHNPSHNACHPRIHQEKIRLDAEIVFSPWSARRTKNQRQNNTLISPGYQGGPQPCPWVQHNLNELIQRYSWDKLG